MAVAVLEMRNIDSEYVDFDPESDMFAAYSKDKQALIAVANIINELIKDDSLMSKALANTSEAEKLDD